MRTLYILKVLLAIMCLQNSFYLTAQQSQTQAPDTIIKKSGVPIIGKIEGKTKFEVLIRIEGEKDIQRINNSVIKEIHYGNGKIEIIEAKTGQMSKEQIQGKTKTKDWTSILVANDGSDLSGFIEKGEIEVRYDATRINMSNSELERNGIVLLRKRAASMGGSVIKVTSKNITREYGSFPFITMKAMVYSTE
ncbi:MAG: hypothetical protein N2662_07855 [Bacteroidales bacterium]|nr:hypothetical protein [Bacteroidales bacterium]